MTDAVNQNGEKFVGLSIFDIISSLDIMALWMVNITSYRTDTIASLTFRKNTSMSNK